MRVHMGRGMGGIGEIAGEVDGGSGLFGRGWLNDVVLLNVDWRNLSRWVSFLYVFMCVCACVCRQGGVSMVEFIVLIVCLAGERHTLTILWILCARK